jgi:arginine/lysine/ornithine decarboxylase
LLGALVDLRAAIKDFEVTTPIALPDPAELELETAVLPRDAFFGPTEMVSAGKAAGRIAAEQITPYPPGIPAVVPGERLNDAVIDYLRSGLAAGMTLPDPADPTLQNICVTA